MGRKTDTSYAPPFSLRLSLEEREALKALAGNVPLGQFIKDQIFKESGLRPQPRRGIAIQDRQLLAQILGALGQSRMSSNINQLAKAANSGSLPVNQETLEALQDAVASIQWVRDTIIKAMGLKALAEPEACYDP